MGTTLKLGIIGLDTSHVKAFTELLNNENHAHHVPGGKVVVAFPGGSPDFELSQSRVEGFTTTLRDDFGVLIVSSPEAVAEASDAILLESVDGRVHLEQFKRIASYRKPVFIDKPFTVNSSEALEIVSIARQYDVPIMTCSSLRYAEALINTLNHDEQGAIIGADCSGPMAIQPTQPGLFWYGIHSVEMLFAILGGGCEHVTATTNEHHDLVVGVWSDGRVGTVRGNRLGNHRFGALIHREKGTQFADASTYNKPYYAGLLEAVMKMFTSGVPDIDIQESVRIVRFIEAANESRQTGRTVQL